MRLVFLLLSIIFACQLSYGEQALVSKRIELPDEAVSKKVLDNGLVILAKASDPRDLAAIDIQIKVGSSLEGEYLGSGISHFVEHLLFKGTRTRKQGDIEREMKSLGGFLNAGTSMDSTDFHVTVPSENLEKALGILKDMLANASFDEREFKRERDVILKEIKLYNDQPENQAAKSLYRTAFITHPYRYPVIGFEERFLQLKRDDLIKYYNRMYVPNRMVVSVVGGVNGAMEMVEKEFKEFKPSDYQPVVTAEEPPQVMKRTVESKDDINLGYLAIGFHSTSIFDKDLFAMDVLAMILGRGNNSRLVSSLVKEKRLAYSVSSWNYTPRDPGLFVITALFDKKNAEEVQRQISEEINMIKSGQLADDEISSAKRMVLSDYIFSRQTLEEQSRDVSSNELLTGSYDFSRRYIDGIQSVTKEDVKDAAAGYLTERNMTVSLVMPRDIAQGTGKPERETPGIKDSIEKEILSNGLRVLLRENRKTPTVGITVAMLGGVGSEDAEDNGISNMASRMLLKGTSTLKEDMIKGAFDSMGGSISAFSGMSSFGVNISILKDDLDRGLGILHSILTDSVFPQDELDKEKELVLAAIKDDDDDIFQRGVNALRRDLYPDAPFGMRYLGEPGTVSAMTRDKLLKFYGTYSAANNIVISISGDIDKADLLKKISGLFKDMKRRDIPPSPATVKQISGVKARKISMDRDQSLLLNGFLTCGIRSDDRYPIDVICSILSGNSGRLFTELRDKMSLAYTLGCAPRFSMETGYLTFYVATTKEKLEESRRALLGQINAIRNAVVTDAELELAKRERLTGYEIDMQTNDFVSFQSAIDELYGIGHDNIFKYKEAISKVSKLDIKASADKYLDPGSCAEIEISPK